MGPPPRPPQPPRLTAAPVAATPRKPCSASRREITEPRSRPARDAGFGGFRQVLILQGPAVFVDEVLQPNAARLRERLALAKRIPPAFVLVAIEHFVARLEQL